MIMRAKMVLMTITDRWQGKGAGGRFCELEWSPVTGKDGEIEEDKQFHKYTPSGSIKLTVDNPPLIEKLKLGQSYYVDFTEAPE